MHRLKYFAVYLLPVTVWFSFNSEGLWTFLPLLVFFVFVPLLELLIKPSHQNFEDEKRVAEKKNKLYDWILYLALPVQLIFLIYFLNIISFTPVGSVEFFGKVFAMGLMCGVIGINVAHELGHRHKRSEQLLAEILLLTSLNTHFLPFHNEGHHREVATNHDPATARKNQSLFHFWISSHFGSYWEAWRIEKGRLGKKDKSAFSLENRMIQYSIANALLLGMILYFFGWETLLAFVLSAIIGILLLETVNYIEHYGLKRQKTNKGRYERVRHAHSWNSDHQIGRLMLFNLSRHSDHHYKASKKYQLLNSLPEAPQMPTGYPGMMVLALLQPLWFKIMNPRLKDLGMD